MSQISEFESTNVNKLFIKFAIPSIIGLLVVSMQIIIDGLFVSIGVGHLGLAAINLVSPLISVMFSITLMIVCGGVVIAGIAKGNKNDELSKSYTTLTYVVLIITLAILSAIVLLFRDDVCIMLGATDDVFEYVKQYVTIIIGGAILYVMPSCNEAFVRLANKPNLVYLSCFTSCIVNVVLDYFFVLKFGWGVQGAAYATIISSAAATFALLPFVHFGKLIAKWHDIKRIFFNGSSEMLISVSAAVTTYVFNLVLMKYIGTLGVAALSIVFYINTIVNFTMFGLAQALQPLVAYNLGAMNYNNIKTLIRTSMLIGAAIGWLTYLAVLLGRNSIVGIFTKGNDELFALANTATCFIIVHYLFSFFNIIASSFHTAIEKPIESAVIGLSRSIVFVLIPLLLLPPLIGETGIWISMPIAEVLSLCVSIPLTIYSLKRLKNFCTQK